MYELPEIWAGTRASFDMVHRLMPQIEAMTAARGSARDDDMGLPPIYEVVDKVAVVSIDGPLISGSAGFFRLFGVLGYGDIQAAVSEAAQQKGVNAFLLSVSSGGGAVDGCDECSEFLKSMSAIKPMVTHARGTMASAAYWLGSSAGAGRIFASRTSIVGSIGTIAVHMERSKQLEKEGIGATVLREGKYKALANSIEPLSKEARGKIQDQLAYSNAMFEERVAANLGVPRSRVHDKMGEGREFMGAQAVEAGLVHGVASSQEAFQVAKLLVRS